MDSGLTIQVCLFALNCLPSTNEGAGSNDSAHGYGVMRYSNGDCYTGEFTRGKPHYSLSLSLCLP